ncbi:hypothetical protein CL615_01410 [archaeon]|nr:hypothetical protein [archaeon]MDP6547498.1 hypothetical protein [Candidatus Woesearchaeota archaeon]
MCKKSGGFFSMSRYKHTSKKKRLAKLSKLTRWAPFWSVPKIYGKTRKVHPGRHTKSKRNWRRTKTKA